MVSVYEFRVEGISRLQLNHVPVHETHIDKVRKITTTSKTLSLTRIYRLMHAGQDELEHPRDDGVERWVQGLGFRA